MKKQTPPKNPSITKKIYKNQLPSAQISSEYGQISFKNSAIDRMGGIEAMKSSDSKVPSATDSLSVYMRNSDSRSVYKPIADAAEQKYGKMDVSGFDITKKRTTNVKQARKKYGLDK